MQTASFEKYCSAEELMQREKGSYQVRWNRYAGQADFLSFRLGVGRRKFPFEIKLSGEQKSIVKIHLWKRQNS